LQQQAPSKLKTLLKTILVCIVNFFGGGLAIINFHSDVDMPAVHRNVYYLLTGRGGRGVLDQRALLYRIALGYIFYEYYRRKKSTAQPFAGREFDQYKDMIKQYMQNNSGMIINGEVLCAIAGFHRRFLRDGGSCFYYGAEPDPKFAGVLYERRFSQRAWALFAGIVLGAVGVAFPFSWAAPWTALVPASFRHIRRCAGGAITEVLDAFPKLLAWAARPFPLWFSSW
jgi:hypothetical protein